MHVWFTFLLTGSMKSYLEYFGYHYLYIIVIQENGYNIYIKKIISEYVYFTLREKIHPY